MMQVRVLYFASLRDAAGVAAEQVELATGDLAALYRACAARHGFAFPQSRMRVAVGDAFVPWDTPLHEGMEAAFIPPVSGG